MAHTRRSTGKLADITGPGITDRWGATCTDLGASVVAPNGTLVSVFGDTFSGNCAGEGDWRSPVILIGTGHAHQAISYHRAGGPDPATLNSFGVTRAGPGGGQTFAARSAR